MPSRLQRWCKVYASRIRSGMMQWPFLPGVIIVGKLGFGCTMTYYATTKYACRVCVPYPVSSRYLPHSLTASSNLTCSAPMCSNCPHAPPKCLPTANQTW
eukprot:s21_g34.t1